MDGTNTETSGVYKRSTPTERRKEVTIGGEFVNNASS